MANCTGKYEAIRGQLKSKDATTRQADAHRDLRNESLISLIDEKRAATSALHSTLAKISRSILPVSLILCVQLLYNSATIVSLELAF